MVPGRDLANDSGSWHRCSVSPYFCRSAPELRLFPHDFDFRSPSSSSIVGFLSSLQVISSGHSPTDIQQLCTNSPPTLQTPGSQLNSPAGHQVGPFRTRSSAVSSHSDKAHVRKSGNTKSLPSVTFGELSDHVNKSMHNALIMLPVSDQADQRHGLTIPIQKQNPPARQARH